MMHTIPLQFVYPKLVRAYWFANCIQSLMNYKHWAIATRNLKITQKSSQMYDIAPLILHLLLLILLRNLICNRIQKTWCWCINNIHRQHQRHKKHLSSRFCNVAKTAILHFTTLTSQSVKLVYFISSFAHLPQRLQIKALIKALKPLLKINHLFLDTIINACTQTRTKWRWSKWINQLVNQAVQDVMSCKFAFSGTIFILCTQGT